MSFLAYPPSLPESIQWGTRAALRIAGRVDPAVAGRSTMALASRAIAL